MKNLKCIWMEAGTIPYQLCPLNFNCDQCDIHKKLMDGGTVGGGVQPASVIVRNPSRSKLEFTPGIQYLPGHFWYQRHAVNRLRLGLDKFLWQLFFSSIRLLIVPEDTSLLQSACFAWLVFNGGTAYLKSPIKGRLKRANPLFYHDPLQTSQLLHMPASELWVIELETDADTRLEAFTKSEYTLSAHNDCDRIVEACSIQTNNTTHNYPGQFLTIEAKTFCTTIKKISNEHIYIC